MFVIILTYLGKKKQIDFPFRKLNKNAKPDHELCIFD